MADVVAALRELFAARPATVARTVVTVTGGTLLVMPAAAPTAAGVKVLAAATTASWRPAIGGAFVLVGLATGRVRAVLDGAALTALRTPAVSAVATHCLAARDAAVLGVVGTGVQARAHVDAMLAIRPTIAEVLVVSRRSDRAAALCADVAAATGRRARPVVVAELPAADIVCTCTPATAPVLDSASLAPGAHINAVGSYRPGMVEVPGSVLTGADVYVDDVDAAREEAGDLLAAAAAGEWAWADLAGDLSTLVTAPRRRQSRRSVFKSVGLAVEDLAVAELVADRLGLP